MSEDGNEEFAMSDEQSVLAHGHCHRLCRMKALGSSEEPWEL